MNIKQTVFSLVFGLTAVTLLAGSVSATGNCTNSYGTSVECPPNNIDVNKKVRHPNDVNIFVENLTSNDPRYSPGDTVEYEIAVTNNSNVTVNVVTVTDTLPTGLTFVGGPGSYNSNDRTLTYKLTNLKAGETVRTRFTAKVREASVFGNADITCDGEKVVNHVKATGPDGQTDQDTASLCVQTKVLGATTLPVAGFEDNAYVAVFGLIAIAGLFLIFKSRRAVS